MFVLRVVCVLRIVCFLMVVWFLRVDHHLLVDVSVFRAVHSEPEERRARVVS